MMIFTLAFVCTLSVVSGEELKIGGRALRKLDLNYRGYALILIEITYNKSFPLFKELNLKCGREVNQTLDTCTECAKASGCGQSSGGGSQLQAFLGALDNSAGKLFKNLGDKSANFLKGVSGVLGSFGASGVNTLKNTFENLGKGAGNGVSDILAGFGKLNEKFKTFFGNVKKTFEKGASQAFAGIKDFGSKLGGVFDEIKKVFKNLPVIGKRSIRERRAIDSCILKACSVCKKVDVPKNATNEQIETVMRDVCPDFTQQTQLADLLASYVNLGGILSKYANLTVYPDHALFKKVLYEDNYPEAEYLKSATVKFQNKEYTVPYPNRPVIQSDNNTNVVEALGSRVFDILIANVNGTVQ